MLEPVSKEGRSDSLNDNLSRITWWRGRKDFLESEESWDSSAHALVAKRDKRATHQ